MLTDETEPRLRAFMASADMILYIPEAGLGGWSGTPRLITEHDYTLLLIGGSVGAKAAVFRREDMEEKV